MQSLDEAIAVTEEQNIGALLITEEVIDPGGIARLTASLLAQPSWSDLPILILTVGGHATALSRRREKDRLPLGSVTLLERPIRVATLISSVRSALRSRSRQYQVRDTLIQRDLAEEFLRESEGKLLLAIQTAHLGAWERNLTTGALDVSPTCRKHFDWPMDEALTGEDLVDRLHPDDRFPMQDKIRLTAETGVPYANEYRVIWRDGTTHWISASGRLVDAGQSLPNGAGQTQAKRDLRVAGVTLDITDRVLSEAALRQADKLALVGRLASSIAHEINNPLEAVTNLLYLLRISDLGPVEKGYVEIAQQELARISEIAAQTLTFNRQQNSFQDAVLSEILDSVLALYQGRLATSNIAIDRRYTYRLPVLCYPGEIRQVFTNLVGNAFDAMRQGGRMRVRVRLATHPVSGARGVRTTVADTGTGMSRDVQSRLFEAFHSTKGNNGTGLGLWISKGIVEKHRGSLRVSSSISGAHRGSVFSVFLPLVS